MWKHKKYEVVQCEDGFSMSIQAGEYNYCEPRNNVGPYSAVEVGYPSEAEPLISQYAEDPDCLTGTVYGWVPSEKVMDVIVKHGGAISGEIPPLVVGGHTIPLDEPS